ncbi:unnamed protein product [Parajaminaea phylloscopi]
MVGRRTKRKPKRADLVVDDDPADPIGGSILPNINVSIPWLGIGNGNGSGSSSNTTNGTSNAANNGSTTLPMPINWGNTSANATGNVNATIPLPPNNGSVPYNSTLLPTPTISGNATATNTSSAAPSKTTVYVTKTGPNGTAKTVQTVVNLVPPASHSSHEALPLGPIIGGVAGGLVAFVIIVWLISIPMRRFNAGRQNPTIDWQTFPPHHNTRHGVGEGEDEEDDDERPINSAVAVLGPAALQSRGNSMDLRDGDDRRPSLQRQHSQHALQGPHRVASPEGYEMTEAQHSGHGYAGADLGTPYGLDALYPYSHLDGGFDPAHAAWYQARGANCPTPTSPTQPGYHMGMYDAYRQYPPQTDPPPPWQPNEAFSEVGKSPPLSPALIRGTSPMLAAARIHHGPLPRSPALPQVPSDGYAGVNPPLDHQDTAGSLASRTVVGSTLGSKRSKSVMSTASHRSSNVSSAAPSAQNSPAQMPVIKRGFAPAAENVYGQQPPPLPADFPAHRIYQQDAAPKPMGAARSMAGNSSASTDNASRAQLSPPQPTQQFLRQGLAPSAEALANRESVMPLSMERFGALRITNALPSEEEHQ